MTGSSPASSSSSSSSSPVSAPAFASLDSWSPFPPPPEQLGNGRFKLVRRIGIGGMSEVWLANDARGGVCAVKLYERRVLDGGRALTRRFLAEIDALTELKHPGIVRPRAAGRDGAFLWYAMDYLQRGSIREVLEAHQRIDPVDALRIAFELLCALDVVHRAGIIHRDVKPGNILVADDGRRVLADFGVARHPKKRVRFRTISGAGIGTMGYAAPELGSDAKNASPATDIYGVTAVLYELVTGESPLRLNFLGVERSVLARVPAALRPLIQKGGAQDPAKRYLSAHEMAAALIKCVAALDEPALAAQWSRELPCPPEAGSMWRRCMRWLGFGTSPAARAEAGDAPRAS